MLLGCCCMWVWRKPGIKEVLVTDRVHRLVIDFWPLLVKTLQIGKVKESLCLTSEIRPALYIYIYYGVSYNTWGALLTTWGAHLRTWTFLSGKRARLLNLFSPGTLSLSLSLSKDRFPCSCSHAPPSLFALLLPHKQHCLSSQKVQKGRKNTPPPAP